MKKIMTLVMMTVIAVSATAMNYSAARNEALFLSDKMAYELGLTATQYEAVYEINLDYLLNVNKRADVFGIWWDVRNRDLHHVLSTWQYDRYIASTWFYRPIIWSNTGMKFAIHTRYAKDRMFNHRPAVYATFKGGHSHRGNSFYSAHRYDKPNPPKGHGKTNSFTSVGNNHNRPSTGNHNPSAPTRTFGKHPSGNIASNGNRTAAPKGTFGARR